MTDRRPLAGRRVLVTRTREAAAGLVDRLHALGAEVVVVPLICTVPIASPEEIRGMVDRLSAAAPPRWVAFTSATAARLVAGALEEFGLRGARVAAVGEATADAVRAALHRSVDLVPGRSDAEGLAAALTALGVAGATVWLPSAVGASEELPTRLRDAGAAVLVQHLYRSAMPPDAPLRLRRALERGVDAVTLTSGSTARNLAAALAGGRLPPDLLAVCIGARTAAAARAVGIRVDAVAEEQSSAGLAAAVSSRLATLP